MLERVLLEHRVFRVLVLAAPTMLTVLSCSLADESRGAHLAISASTFECANPIDVSDELPDGWYSVADVVALPGDRILQRGRFDSELGRSFLQVRAGSAGWAASVPDQEGATSPAGPDRPSDNDARSSGARRRRPGSGVQDPAPILVTRPFLTRPPTVTRALGARQVPVRRALVSARVQSQPCGAPPRRPGFATSTASKPCRGAGLVAELAEL